MTTPTPPAFIDNAGGCLVSRRIMDGSGILKWMLRDPSANPADNGWRFFADTDDDASLSDPANIQVVDFNTVAAVEPAILAVYHLPVGADLQLVIENGRRTIVDNRLGRPAVLDSLGEWAARIRMAPSATAPGDLIALSDQELTLFVAERGGRFIVEHSDRGTARHPLGSTSDELDARSLLVMIIGEYWRSEHGMPRLTAPDPARPTTLVESPTGWVLSWSDGDAEFPPGDAGRARALTFSRLVGATVYDVMTAFDDPEGRPLFG